MNTNVLGPYTKNEGRLIADGRSTQARRYRQYVRELSEDIGGNPAPSQRILIERTAMLLVRLSFLDNAVMTNADFTQHDNNQYVAWQNAVRRNLVALEQGRRSVFDLWGPE